MLDDNREKLTKIEELVKEWVSKQGHEKCWYYPEIFRAVAPVLATPQKMTYTFIRNQFGIRQKEGKHNI